MLCNIGLDLNLARATHKGACMHVLTGNSLCIRIYVLNRRCLSKYGVSCHLVVEWRVVWDLGEIVKIGRTPQRTDEGRALHMGRQTKNNTALVVLIRRCVELDHPCMRYTTRVMYDICIYIYKYM